MTWDQRFRKPAFGAPYPDPHTLPNGGRLPPDGRVQPESPGEQSGLGLSYPAGHDFGSYVQRLGECPEMWYGIEPSFECNGLPFSAGNIHPHTGLLLWSLVVNMRPTVIVETGTFYGYSTWFLAQALHWWNEGTVYTIDPDFRYVAECVRQHPRVKMIPGRSLDVLPKLLYDLEGEVHFAFLDSYKRQALAEFQMLDKAIVPGGIVAFHDTQVFNTGKGLWSLLKTHPHYDRMLFAGTPAVDNPHHYFGNADDRGLFVLRKREADPFLNVADHGTHSETLVSTGQPLGDLLIGLEQS